MIKIYKNTIVYLDKVNINYLILKNEFLFILIKIKIFMHI